MKHIISLGAGVQSSCMALMFAEGELTPMPDCAIFADTGAEPQSVYDWLDWLEQQLPFPVYRVAEKGGSLTDRSLEPIKTSKKGKKYVRSFIPMFTHSKGKSGMLWRKCTRDFKITPIIKKVKEIIGHKPNTRLPKEVVCVQYIGISTDEAIRMKPSQLTFIEHQWPLIDANMSRQGCKDWMQAKGYAEPPRSACVYCPYHSNAEWQRLKTDEPEGFSAAVKFEKDCQKLYSGHMEADSVWLHASRRPLDQIDFTTQKDQQLDMFGEDCEGMCGV